MRALAVVLVCIPFPAWALCGDGTLDADETCDCGSADCTTADPCCDGLTCELVMGASCSSLEPCCTPSCTIETDTSVVCAPMGHPECSTTTYCNGVSPQCHRQGALPLTACTSSGGRAGHCYFGACVSQDEQCSSLPGQDPSVGCMTTRCDHLRCAPAAAPMACVNWIIDSADGTRCGPSAICVGATCVPLTSIDYCPWDRTKTQPGTCGCGIPDTNSDGDGEPDCRDLCPSDPSTVMLPCADAGVPDPPDAAVPEPSSSSVMEVSSSLVPSSSAGVASSAVSPSSALVPSSLSPSSAALPSSRPVSSSRGPSSAAAPSSSFNPDGESNTGGCACDLSGGNWPWGLLVLPVFRRHRMCA